MSIDYNIMIPSHESQSSLKKSFKSTLLSSIYIVVNCTVSSPMQLNLVLDFNLFDMDHETCIHKGIVYIRLPGVY